MQLHRCAPPTGPLERAPMTALRPHEGRGEWAAFWSGDDGYYARLITEDGGAEWFEGVVERGVAARAPRAITPRGVRTVPACRTLSAVGRVGPNAALALVGRSSRRRRA